MVTFMEFSWFDFSRILIRLKGFVFTCRFVFFFNVFKHIQGEKIFTQNTRLLVLIFLNKLHGLFLCRD